MNENATPIEALFEKATDYSKTSVELLRLKAIAKSADIVSSLTTQFVIIIAVAIFVTSLNVGVGLWLGDLFGKTYYGFFAIAIFDAIIALLVYGFRHKWIKIPVNNAIIIQMQK